MLKGFLPPEKKPTRPPTDYEIFIDKYGLKPACPYCTSRLYHPHGLDDYDAYTRYCDNNAIPHYIQPSDMKKIVRKEQKDWAEKHNGKELAEETILRNTRA